MKKNRGYFGIGILNTKTEQNIGTLWRSAAIMGASFIFTIGKRYKTQSTDTMKSHKHIPLYNYETFEDFKKSMPIGCKLVGIEIDENSIPIERFTHPERCVYILGSEDIGITSDVIKECDNIVQLPGDYCMNVAVAGSIVMYDRIK